MQSETTSISAVSEQLARLHSQQFGGKPNGRFRISTKLLRKLARRKRLYEDDIRDLTRAMLERGFVLIDMDGFFVVMSANTFVNYRRANEDVVS